MFFLHYLCTTFGVPALLIYSRWQYFPQNIITAWAIQVNWPIHMFSFRTCCIFILQIISTAQVHSCPGIPLLHILVLSLLWPAQHNTGSALNLLINVIRCVRRKMWGHGVVQDQGWETTILNSVLTYATYLMVTWLCGLKGSQENLLFIIILSLCNIILYN